MAMPPLRKRQASRKFYVPVGVSGRDHTSQAVALTKRVMANVYKTKMNRNLKKCAASCARPAIQYVLGDHQCFEWICRQGCYSHSRYNDSGYDT